MREVLRASPVRTQRLVVRCWQIADAPLLKAAIDASLAHLRPWMPWAMHEPSSLEVVEARLTGFRDRFGGGKDWLYGIFDAAETEVVGGAGLHHRAGGMDVLEIGYWIRVDLTGRGFATETAEALTTVGFAALGARRMEIRCDPQNVKSMRVPWRLGYKHVQTLREDALTSDGAVRDTMVWSMSAAEWDARGRAAYATERP
jgi:RimJ/RimL family protein N-acetyltransferase